MAQRQRAGLITPRSQDRNLLPVLYFVYQNHAFNFLLTPSSIFYFIDSQPLRTTRSCRLHVGGS
jgi:hypothetical protein